MYTEVLGKKSLLLDLTLVNGVEFGFSNIYYNISW